MIFLLIFQKLSLSLFGKRGKMTQFETTPENPIETLDCSGAGMCQPEPNDETDGGEKQELVQQAMDKKRARKKKSLLKKGFRNKA